MVPEQLGPSLELLCVEYVLVQAWKKTASNGRHGGSNAYWPRSDAYISQVVHTHGQPQASISFLEIEEIGAFLEHRNLSGANAADWKLLRPV